MALKSRRFRRLAVVPHYFFLSSTTAHNLQTFTLIIALMLSIGGGRLCWINLDSVCYKSRLCVCKSACLCVCLTSYMLLCLPFATGLCTSLIHSLTSIACMWFWRWFAASENVWPPLESRWLSDHQLSNWRKAAMAAVDWYISSGRGCTGTHQPVTMRRTLTSLLVAAWCSHTARCLSALHILSNSFVSFWYNPLL